MLKDLKSLPAVDEYDIGRNLGIEDAARHYKALFQEILVERPILDELDEHDYSAVRDYDETLYTWLLNLEDTVRAEFGVDAT